MAVNVLTNNKIVFMLHS